MAQRSRRAHAAPQLPPQSLLILHLDAPRLRRDGLHLGSLAAYSAVLSAIALDSEVDVRDINECRDLDTLGSEFKRQRKQCDVVVVVAHSNQSHIRVAHDALMTWAQFARWLAHVSPRRLLLVACQAGRWDAGNALFKANRRLRRIYACPVNATKDFGALLMCAAPYLVAERTPKAALVRYGQIAAIATTGCQLREWRRTVDGSDPLGFAHDILADVAHPILKSIFRRPP